MFLVFCLLCYIGNGLDTPLFANSDLIPGYKVDTHARQLLGGNHGLQIESSKNIGCQWYSRDYDETFSPMNVCWCQKSDNINPNCEMVTCNNDGTGIMHTRYENDSTGKCQSEPTYANSSNIHGFYSCNNEGYMGSTCNWGIIQFMDQNDTDNTTCTKNENHFGSQSYVLNSCLNYTNMNSIDIGYWLECHWDYDENGVKRYIMNETIFNNQDCTDVNESNLFEGGCEYKDLYIEFNGCWGDKVTKIDYFNHTVNITTSSTSNKNNDNNNIYHHYNCGGYSIFILIGVVIIVFGFILYTCFYCINYEKESKPKTNTNTSENVAENSKSESDSDSGSSIKKEGIMVTTMDGDNNETIMVSYPKKKYNKINEQES